MKSQEQQRQFFDHYHWFICNQDNSDSYGLDERNVWNRLLWAKFTTIRFEDFSPSQSNFQRVANFDPHLHLNCSTYSHQIWCGNPSRDDCVFEMQLPPFNSPMDQFFHPKWTPIYQIFGTMTELWEKVVRR